MEEIQQRKVTLQASVSNVSVDEKQHSNIMKITGTCMMLDELSTFVPHGVDRPVLLSSVEAEKSANTMNFMGINCDYDPYWDVTQQMTCHNIRHKVGVVDKCWVDGNELKFSGVIYKNDFPDVAELIKKTADSLGFSVEAMFNAHEYEDRIEMIDVQFTGLAILWKDSASYQDTYIAEIVANKKESRKETSMNKDEVMQIVNETLQAHFEIQAKAEADAKLSEEMVSIKAENDALKAEIESKNALLAEKDEVIAKLEEDVKAKEASIEASKQEESITSDVNNLEFEKKLEASKTEKIASWADAVASAMK